MLAVNFSPEGYLSFELFQILKSYAENLGVKGIQPKINKPRINQQSIAIGMHKCLLPITVGNLDKFFIKRSKILIPCSRINQKSILASPIIHKRDGIHIGLRPFFHQLTIECKHLVHKFQHIRRGIYQIHIKFLCSPDKLQLLKGSWITACHHKFICAFTKFINLPGIKIQQFYRNMYIFPIAPLLVFY